ncbi:MAG TPA: hypothetical protein VHS58_02220 [Acetobacteraceae bacterium]|jgi:flagellar assembly protein FliH|nr:hypothetical protein [Acetobacteraceae bacterium]
MTLATDIRPRYATLGALFIEDFNDDAGITVLDDEPTDVPPPAEPSAPPPAAPDIDAIRDEAFADGLRAGTERAEAQRTEALARLATALTESLAETAATSRAHAEESATAIARVALGALCAALPTICARFGAAEVAALARAVLPGLSAAPRIAIRVHPADTRALEVAVASLEPELVSRLEITPSAALPEGDLRMGWQDGHASRETGPLLRAIGDELAMLGLLDDGRQFGAVLMDRRNDA